MPAPSVDISELAVARPPVELEERLAAQMRAMQDVNGFRAGAVVRRDGLPIHHTFRSEREAASLCATAAAVVGASLVAGEEMGQDTFAHGLVQYRGSSLVLAEAGPEAIVACLLGSDVNMGLALLTIRKVAKGVQGVLDEI